MILDLSNDGSFTSEINKTYNDISKENINNFNKILNIAYEKNYKNLPWYLTLTASRNHLNSKLFKNFCYFFLVDKLVSDNKNNITKIVTDSKGLHEIFKKNYGDSITIKLKKKNFYYNFKLFLIRIYEFLLKFYQYFISHYTKILFKKKKINNKLILIDTYVFEGFIDKERYYNYLLENTKNIEKKNIYFLPTISNINFKNIYRIYKELRNSKKNYLIKEDLIKFWDYFEIFLILFKITKISFKNVVIKGIDFSPIINDDLRLLNNSILHTIEGYLSYKAIKYLKKRRKEISLFINWWENQTIDKAYNYSLSETYPETKTVGYIGFAPRNFDFHLFPTRYEKYHRIIPKKISVIGSSYINQILQFSNETLVTTAPSFRFDHIFKYTKSYNNNNNKIILIGLPILLSKSIELINSIPKDLDTIFKQYKIKLLIKPHPSISKQVISNYIDINSFNNCIITSEDTYNLLKETDLMISSMSSICMESIAMNIPCIVYDESKGFEYMPIPDEIEKSIWKFCKKRKDIIDSINYFFNMSNDDYKKNYSISQYVKKNYFLEVDRKNVLDFLELKNN